MLYLIEAIFNLILESSLRGTVFAIGVLTVAFAIGYFVKTTFDFRHRVWSLILLGFIGLPLMCATMPQWSVPLPISWANSNASNPVQKILAENHGIAPRSELGDSEKSVSSTASAAAPIHSTRSNGTDENMLATDELESAKIVETLTKTPPQSKADFERAFITNSSTFVFAWNWKVSIITVWFAVLFLLLVRLFLALLITANISHKAQRVASNDLGLPLFPFSVFESRKIQTPVVINCFFPRVILPLSWREWSHDRITAVLAHEGAHIRRRDGLVQLLAEIIVAVYWFHPLAWINRNRLLELAELSCDAEAVKSCGDRIGYAKHLIAIAESNLWCKKPRIGIAMANSSHISRRVRALIATSHTLSARTSYSIFMILVLISIPMAVFLSAASPLPQLAQSTKVEAPEQEARPIDEPKFSDWLLDEGEQTKLRIHGKILDSENKPAIDCRLLAMTSSRTGKGMTVIPVKLHENEFEFDLIGADYHSLELHAMSFDGTRQVVQILLSQDMRRVAREGLNLTLQNSRDVRIQVLDTGKPVSAANVEIGLSYLIKAKGTTDEYGFAIVRLPKRSRILSLLAWTNDYRLAGQNLVDWPLLSPLSSEFTLDLQECIPHRIQVLDEQEKPVESLPVKLSIAVQENKWIPDFDQQKLVTNEEGIAVTNWCLKKGNTRGSVYVSQSGWHITSKNQNDSETIIHVQRLNSARTVVRGLVTGPDALRRGVVIECKSFEGETESRGDNLYARTNSSGEFELSVIPGATYIVQVSDSDLVSEFWEGIIVDRESGAQNVPKLEVRHGELVEILLTQGIDESPVVGQYVSLGHYHPYSWKEKNGEERHGRGQCSWNTITNELGRASARVMKGDTNIRIYSSDWREQTQIDVESGQRNFIHLRKPGGKDKTVAGQITISGVPEADLSGCKLQFKSFDKGLKWELTATTNSEGRFKLMVPCTRLVVYARTRDELADGSTFMEVTDDKSDLTLELAPTKSFRGRVLGESDQPIQDRTFVLEARINKKDLDAEKDDPFASTYFSVGKFFSKSDENGFFEFKCLPCNTIMSFDSYSGDPAKTQWHGYRYLLSDENRPLEAVHIKSSVPTSPVSFTSRLEDRLRDSKLNNTHVLTVVHGASPASDELRRRLLDYDTFFDVASFLTIRVSPEIMLQNQSDAESFLKAHDWPKPNEDYVFLAALDPTGKEIERLKVPVDGRPESQQAAFDFVTRNAPRQLDAMEKWTKALVDAKTSGRKVWLVTSQTRCQPCFVFARWWEENRSLLEKDYVLLKVDNIRDLHGLEVANNLGKVNSIPTHGIFHGEGFKLIDSISPTGNIGMPSEFEGIRHLKRMLQKTATNLSEQDIEKIISSLPKD